MKDDSYIVIGAGLAGVTIANELAKNAKVTLLEKGSEKVTIPQKKYISRPFGSSTTYCNSIGGTTNLWHNGLIDLAPNTAQGIFKNILEDIEQYKDLAANALNFIGSYKEEKEQLISFYKEILKDNSQIDTILIPKKAPPLKPNNSISIHQNVSNIKFTTNKNRVNSVQFNSDNSQHSIEADKIIFCGGGIGTPSLVANLYQQLHPEQSTDLIGKNLIDHPMGFIGKIKVKPQFVNKIKTLCFSENKNHTSRCGIVVKNKGLNHIFYFRPAMTMNNSLSLYKFKSKLGSSTLKDRLKLMLNPKILHLDIIQEILAYVFNIRITSQYFSVWAVFEQSSPSSNFVKPSNSTEDIINWDISQQELANYQESITIFEKYLTTLTSFSVFEKEDLSSFLWSAAHHSGTCTFGNEIGNIDENLKLNDTENVYVCDGSVIPSHSYTNTGLTIAQLCFKLTNYLTSIREIK